MEMTDEELKEYIPQKGDRIVVKAFACKEKNETQSEKRKLTLLENLRAKMTTKSAKKNKSASDSDFEVSNSSPGSSSLASAQIASTLKTDGVSRKIPAARDHDNTNKSKQSQIAIKSVRSVIVGFCIYEKNGTESKYQQVRAPMGEGIRNITINKTATKSELMDKISVLFFPDGKKRSW